MMKKIKGGGLLGAALLLLTLIKITNCYAEGALFGHGTDDKVSTHVIKGTSGIVTAITSSDRILGYSVTGSANAIVGFYNSNVIFAEGGCLANDMRTVLFPFPKEVDSRFLVQVNAATTIVTIFYE